MATMRLRTKVRKLINALGIDAHRYIRQPGKLDFLKQYDIKTVLDIGANVGQSALEFRAILPLAYIYSFEPLPDCFEKLTSAMRGDEHFKAFPFALGATAERLAMKKSVYAPASSLMEMGKIHKEALPYTARVESETNVEVRRLDDVATELSLAPEILIKMDVQGFESNVIEGGQRTMRSARIVLLENSFYELYVGQALFDEIYERMKGLGFSYRGSISRKYLSTGDILFEDSVFVRT